MRDDRPGEASQEPEASAAGAAPGGSVTPFPGATRGRPAAARPDRAAPARFRLAEPRHNLPLQLTSFVGREQALAEVGRLLATTRLLLLSGAPGVGKTRLALRLAREVLEAYADGVWLVELAPLGDPALVPQAVAAVLGVQEHRGRPLLEGLVDALRAQQVLLVLDNCEHVVAACATLADRLLRACPQLEILATSREALGVAGETAWWVPSLAVPVDAPPAGAEDVARLGECEAVRLFVERAGAAVPTFALTERNAQAVGRVCRRLDGIPLAIELAAARVRALPVEQLAARLDDRFRLLTAGSRVALPRQQTLRAAVDWSHTLLPEAERVLLRRLAVFAGGWTLEAAEGVCAGDGLAAVEILPLLVQLVDKSLVLAEQRDGEVRYRLLETLRQYGWDKLRETAEEASVRTRHLAWFVAVARRAYSPLWGPDQVTWFTRLETERGNFRAAAEWGRLALERAENQASPALADVVLDPCRTVWRFWQTRGRFSETRQRLTELLARAPARTAARANALWVVGYLALLQGDFPAARSLLEEGLVVAREARHTFGTTMSLLLQGALAMIAGDLESAAALMEESLAPLSEVPDETDRYAATIVSIYWRVELARCQGDYGQAIALLEGGLALARDRGDTWSIAFGLSALGRLAWLKGEYQRATRLQQESLVLRRDLKDGLGITICLEGLAWAASAQARPLQAARLFGSAEALRERIAASWPAWLAEHERSVAATRASLGEDAFAAAWAAGRALSVDAAIAEALGEGEPAPTPAAPLERAAAPTAADPLSSRELEVAMLLARGYTNRQIAEELVISEWTVDTHVRHILNKLSFRSRAQVATWATEQGLLASKSR